jgi:hypothetical protein
MTLEELKQSNWYKEMPDVIQRAICKLPPIQPYRFKDNGHQCLLYSYEEPTSENIEDVTCTVFKTGKGGVMSKIGLGELDTRYVFGVLLDELEPWTEEKEGKQ